MKRINYIDTMKAMGITLVVLGHAAWLNENIYTLIYSFHMPLFFLSGYLASSKREVKQSLIKLFQRLILPFTFFFLIYFGYH
ncbi:acyltransferase family protein [Pseudoalteromonas tetraodonis]|uniref:acyltransferase family protein n=1 Tax=Pseudoalteromonas tetraodonis TaxID=43659 RepID=UPI001BDE3298|nr:acyltransferase family protein [Pseudoalteromonas tetraodonis]